MLRDAMDCSASGFPVHHQLLEFIQTHVHQVGDAIHHLILCCPLLLPSTILPSIWVFSVGQFFASGGQSFSFSISPSNEYSGLIFLGWTPCISLQFKGLSRVFSNTTVQKHQFFGAQLSLYSNSQVKHDYWKNHSFDKTDLCWQSNVSAC